MPRLPQPGSDDGQWGEILNDYLSQSLNSSGQLRANSVGEAQLQQNAVTSDAIAPGAVDSSALAANAVTKSDVGLGNVDNTSDADKPVSVAAQQALNSKVSGPSSSVLNTVPRFADETGLVLKGSSVQIKDDGNMSTGDSITSANATRPLNLISTNATMRILRVHSAFAPAVELMSRATPDGANLAYWDMYAEPTNGAFYVRDRVSSPYASRMSILTNGNVGFGVQDPQAKVDVGGDLRVAGKITNVTNPTDAQDAVTKNYADTLVGGKVSGPATATLNSIARFGDTTGKVLKESAVTISDAGAIDVNGTGMTTTITNNNVTFNRPNNVSYIGQHGTNANIAFTTRNTDNSGALTRIMINSGDVGRVTISNANLYLDSNAGGGTRLQVEGNVVANGQLTTALTTAASGAYGARTTLLTSTGGIANLMAASSTLRTTHASSTVSGAAHLAQVQFDGTSPISGGDLIGLQARILTDNNTGTGPINRFAAINAGSPTSAKSGAAYSLVTSHGVRIDNQGVWSGVASAATVTNAVGMYLSAQTGATGANYGIYFDSPVAGVGSGISWAGDTSLYRSAASVLRTDGLMSSLNYVISIATRTASVTLSAGHSGVNLCNATSGALTVTLPAAGTTPGIKFVIKKIDATSNAVTIATSSGQTIDGATTYTLATQNKYVEVCNDGSQWFVIANN